MMVSPVETIRQYYRVDTREISYFRYILEAYDGLGVLTTIDARTGHVALVVAPGCEQDVAELVDSLRKEMLIEPSPPPVVSKAGSGDGTVTHNTIENDDEIFLY